LSDFTAILVEGLFYEQDGQLQIEQDDGTHVSVVETLAPVLGQRVQFAIHHLPPDGPVPGEPGAGSCRFPGGVGCPSHHDKQPNRLLSFHLEGVLRAEPWRIERFDGSTAPIPFVGMPGHFGRLATATVVDVEAMRDSLAGMDLEALAAKGLGGGDLQEVLDKLQKAMKQT
jgi:hypothetical protein